jgi:hypothetical protein
LKYSPTKEGTAITAFSWTDGSALDKLSSETKNKKIEKSILDCLLLLEQFLNLNLFKLKV